MVRGGKELFRFLKSLVLFMARRGWLKGVGLRTPIERVGSMELQIYGEDSLRLISCGGGF